MAAKEPLIAIVGVTASGKTSLALKLAQKYNGEIISADSWTVYRDFNVGTAKPTEAEQQLVPHHLINIVDAKNGFNAALFKELAKQAIKDIQKKGKVPFLVGGTGLYIDSVVYDFSFLPTVNNERERLNGLSLDELLSEAKQKKIDLSHIDTRNKRRVIRAIETGGQYPKKASLRPNTIILGLKPDKGDLRARIERRVNQMIQGGLENEVKELAAKYGWQTEPMKGIGYKEWQDYFDGRQSIELTRQRIISATYQLAKRQMTWFKRNPKILWVNNFEQANDAVKNFLEQ